MRLTNAPLSDDFDRITEWLEGDGWDALMESQGGEFVVSLALLADDLTIDRDLYSEDWFDPDTAVTDVARGRYLRVRIDRCVEAADAGDVSTAYAYTLEVRMECLLSSVASSSFKGKVGRSVG